MTSTTQYQFSLPFVLLSASPSLAALHATRARILHPTESASLDSTHCMKCGTYLLNGDGAVSIVRPSKGRRSSERVRRVIRRTCGICGVSHDIPIYSSSGCLFPRISKNATSSGTTISAPMAQYQPSEEAPETSKRSLSPPQSSSVGSYNANFTVPPAQRRSKSRAKQKSGLQDMLSRNREKVAKQGKVEREGQGGLTAFLSGL
ncbi:hypothetical protein PILCRDRAFT_811351 [Piloderma croceum F 1598]|uniref:Rpr2-domain-containing protein n=1 Tax=Piloderma croceum (strain F 1598) TaxID=765440 RepID=A0A0C3GJN9_PILCF|nr:hypothetical protein PILCRDRAFT_811351 [Piloderma croceum F 1598]